MPLVGTRPEYRITHKTTRLAILSRVVVHDYAIFLDGFRRNAGDSARHKRAASALALVVIVVALDQEVPHPAACAVDSRSPSAAIEIVGDRSRQKVDELVRIAVFQREILPHTSVQQRGDA